MLKKAQHVTTKGKKDNEYLFRFGVNENKTSVFNGVIRSENRFECNGELKDIDILFAGVFDKFRKGPQRALSVIQNVITQFPEIRAVFIGKGPFIE